MEKIGTSTIWSFLDQKVGAQKVSNGQVRTDPGYRVQGYLELAAKVAELQFRNRDYVLVFRGQQADFKSIKGFTTLKPTLFRPPAGAANLTRKLIDRRFECLEFSEKRLIRSFEKRIRFGRERVGRQRLLRWSILQHYEVCPTPLIDVTHSLRIAASFASDGDSAESFVFVLALPNISGAYTASAEAGLQIVRLASICPPSAIRPHIQEGYLLGEYPEISDPDQITRYKPHQLDFGLRLVAKFRFDTHAFWTNDNTFPPISHEALYPPSKDWLEETTAGIRADILTQAPLSRS